MKFYKYKHSFYYWNKIINNKLNAIYSFDYVMFFKNGLPHNNKNAAYIENSGYKEFILNDITFGCAFDFAKKSWRRFVKLQAFL
jgi:hypothetical protein